MAGDGGMKCAHGEDGVDICCWCFPGFQLLRGSHRGAMGRGHGGKGRRAKGAIFGGIRRPANVNACGCCSLAGGVHTFQMAGCEPNACTPETT